MSTCRVCKKYILAQEQQFKYGARHYAHGACGLRKFGAAFLDMIPAHRLGSLPYIAVSDAGLLSEVERRMSTT